MLGFIVAIGAGFVTPHLEGPVVGPLEKLLEGHIRLEAAERRAVAFMVAMLAASVAAAVLNSGSPFWIIPGGVLGYFALRIFDAVKALLDDRSADQG